MLDILKFEIACTVNLTIYFVNLSNYQPYVIRKPGSYDVGQIGMQIRFETLDECPLNIITSVMSNHDQVWGDYFIKLTKFSFLKNKFCIIYFVYQQ